MKLKFNQNLSHQKAPWEAIATLFSGQESCFTPFTMSQPAQWTITGQGVPELESKQ